MSRPSSAYRVVALTISRTSYTQVPRSSLFSCQTKPQRVAYPVPNARRDCIYGGRRSLFTASHHQCAEAAAAPKPTTSSPLPNQQPPSTASAPRTLTPTKPTTASLTSGFSDQPINLTEEDPSQVDWTSSFHGLSVEPFKKEAADILLQPLNPEDVEIKPDGIIYLPEIKYRRILNKAFGPGGWGLAPRGESIVTPKAITREYALLAHGRYVGSLCYQMRNQAYTVTTD